MMDYDTPSRVSSRNGRILPSQPPSSPPQHDYASLHLCAPTYKKVAGSRTCWYQRKFLKCNGAKARKADDQDVIQFNPLCGLTITHDVFFEHKSRATRLRSRATLRCPSRKEFHDMWTECQRKMILIPFFLYYFFRLPDPLLPNRLLPLIARSPIACLFPLPSMLSTRICLRTIATATTSTMTTSLTMKTIIK